MLGDVFEGNGVVVAPPQKQQRELWDEITVSLIVPSPEGDEDPTALDALTGQAVAGLRDSAENVETMQRQQRTVDQLPAQMLKVRYRDKATAHDWVEELVFIQGPENEIYSVSLKCSPENLARREPVFAGVVESWRLPEQEPASGAEEDAAHPPKPN
jgi:hypothetical protein